MAKPQKPQDAFVANGWYLNLPVAGILSNGLFETLEGMGKSSGNVEMVDAGSNHVYNFTDQLTRYDEMTLTRTYQGNAADRAMEALVSTMIETGMKLPATAVKMHRTHRRLPDPARRQCGDRSGVCRQRPAAHRPLGPPAGQARHPAGRL